MSKDALTPEAMCQRPFTILNKQIYALSKDISEYGSLMGFSGNSSDGPLIIINQKVKLTSEK